MDSDIFHNKIVPQFVWARYLRERSNVFILQCTYERSDVWNYRLGAVLYNGAKSEEGFEALTFLLQFGEGHTPETRVITGCVFGNWQKGSATKYTFSS
jgi:hypothetical protein